MNENDAYIFEVETPTRWVFDGQPVWISGWFVSKVGARFSDIRAVIDGVPWSGLLGLPRPEIELRHRGNVGLPHAGFVLRVRPPIGAREIRLELRDTGHRWVEIWRRRIRVWRGPWRRPRFDLSLLPYLAVDVLQAERAGADLRTAARETVAEHWVQPLDMLPVPPFFGALEQPANHCPTQFGKLIVLGWIVHLEQPIVRLRGSTDPHLENIIPYGDRPREDAGRMFPDLPRAARSAFFGMLDIDETAPNPAHARIEAELADGSRHTVFLKRFKQRPCRREERPLPAYSEFHVTRAALALVRALIARRVRVGGPARLVSTLRQARRWVRERSPSQAIEPEQPGHAYQTWLRINAPTPRVVQGWRELALRLEPGGPRFLLVIDATDTAGDALRRLAASLSRQHYGGWQAQVIGPTRLQSAVEQLPGDGARWRFVPCPGAARRTDMLNTAAKAGEGTHLALLRGDDRLSPDALLQIADHLDRHPDVEIVYTDEDRMTATGERDRPCFKAAWSPPLADAGLLPGQLAVVRRDRFLEHGGLRPAFAEVAWHDLFLRLMDDLPLSAVGHVPRVCCHRSADRPDEIEATHPGVEQARHALAEAMGRRGWPAQPFLPETARRRRTLFHQLRWDHASDLQQSVTVVIPTRDRLHLLQECVELLEETLDWRRTRLVIVDDHSRDADALRYLEMIQRRTDLRCVVVRPPDAHAPFNYSRLVNAALPHVDTPLILHLNNDVNALEPGWLEEMAGWFSLPAVGVVGAKLVFPDKTLNHTAIVIGAHGGLADTPWVRVHENDVPDIESHAAVRDVSAVTGACLMTRTDLYRQLGGLDEREFGVAYNDVDYCLRAREAGWRVIYTPQAKLMHWGSATRGVTFSDEEHIAFARRYGQHADPFLSPHVEWDEGRLRVRPARSVHTARAPRLRLLLVTHNLNFEGAPLFLIEYARWMARSGGCSLQVITCQDGPMRPAYEELGAGITVIDRHPIFSAETAEQFEQRVAEVRTAVPMEEVDLVVANTLMSFWAVHLARQAGKASLWYIHESASLYRFFHQMLPAGMLDVVRTAFHQTTRALFLCRATRAYYEDENVRRNYRIVRSWIRLADIDAFKRNHDRASLRRKHGFAEDDVVIANIGTVCERKGQHVFIRAVEHFNRLHGGPGPHRFVMVGARPGIFLDSLLADLEQLALPNISLVPETNEAFDFMALADLFVCSSFEESFPRVVLEAMAFRTPIVSTDVHGIPEMVRQRAEAYLVPPGDAKALAVMMRTCLAKERSGRSLTATAYSKLLRYYDYDRVLPGHLDLAREAWLAFDPEAARCGGAASGGGGCP